MRSRTMQWLAIVLAGALMAPVDQAAAQSVGHCQRENVAAADFSGFKPEWRKAIIDRLSGDSVTVENGLTTDGPGEQAAMTRLLSQVQSYFKRVAAKSYPHCDAAVSDDPAVTKELFATLLIAVACRENEWNPAENYLEKWGAYSTGLLSLTYDRSNGPRNGCLAQNQDDLKEPVINLMCGIGLMKAKGFERTMESDFRGHLQSSFIKAAINKQCQSHFQQINRDLSTASVRSINMK